MNHKLSILLAVGLLAGSLVVPSHASMLEVEPEIQMIQTQYGEIRVETVLNVRDTEFYSSSTRSAEKTSTYRYGGNVIAQVTLEATFGYDGQDAWVKNTDTSYVTYSGWSCGKERITDSGNRAHLTAELTHFFDSPIPVDISMTCTPSGQIS